MSLEPFSEVVPECQISNERETYESELYTDWLKFGNEVFRKGDEEDNVSEIKNKEIIGWDSFKKRMVVLNESETSDKKCRRVRYSK